MKAQELRQKKESELLSLLNEQFKQLQDYRFQAAVRKLSNPHLINQTKKTIARILTILIEKTNSHE